MTSNTLKDDSLRLVEQIRELLEGEGTPSQTCFNHLQLAKNHLETSKAKGKRKVDDDKQSREKRHKKSGMHEIVRFQASKRILQFLVEHVRNHEQTQEFEEKFIVPGHKGYQRFRTLVRRIVEETIETTKKFEERIAVLNDLDKKGGWIDNTIIRMKEQIWDPLSFKMKFDEGREWIDLVGLPTFENAKVEQLTEWSKKLLAGSKESNVSTIYGNALERAGDLGRHYNLRPSRLVGNTRHLCFLEEDQVRHGELLGGGAYGQVFKCTVKGIPYVPENTTLACKQFLGNPDERRKSAVREVIQGGLKHKGIVGPIAMTMDDPPSLVFDYYNGGTLDAMLKGIKKSHYPNEAAMMIQDELDMKDIGEMKLFMANRVGICFAILKTFGYMHEHHRIHNDLHLANIMLHFKYDRDGRPDSKPLKIFVGVCDFGRTLYESECLLVWEVMEPTPAHKTESERKKYPHLAPEIISPKPKPYSQASDIFALGNVFECVLNNKSNYDKLAKRHENFHPEWNANFHARLVAMIRLMQHKDPKKRETVKHWIDYMQKMFPQFNLRKDEGDFLLE
jgi:serine/threonine protein kinase